MAVAIKVGYPCHDPASRKSRPSSRLELKTLLLRYHIAVCSVLELNRRRSGWPSRLKSTTPNTLQPAEDVVGGSIAIPPAPPGTDAVVIGTGSVPPFNTHKFHYGVTKRYK